MTTRYWVIQTNVDTTCDAGAAIGDFDFTKTDPASEGSQAFNVSGITSFTEVGTWDIEVSGDNPSTGSHTLNIVLEAFTSANCRMRVQQINDSGCGVTNSSSYSTTYSASTTATDSLSLTWSAGSGGRYRLSLEGVETSTCGRRTFAVATLGASYVDAPWDPAVAGAPGWPGSHGGWT